ncbi:MAG: hypothetical protein Q7U98_02250 [Methylicorpusculum sp.]|uniref:hypothetical protein n=1 Tax=Methylicorpusculum sp. TaxID=2713644 RepID=UPI00271E776F|nr:hypothetical protein [Methylicorpusculum sp.]MDO8845465.1 hypothetical protein [Methylicorpusculum sp.]MDO8937959.1 hypothetical protein [Methylicorpusculum sp.]MDO9241183.1 hypothetical protein [Methylicorpusculum sp.]MDP2177252.1 hypothetical protein [Methylicorpusculum sp.]MDP2201395.1 hypothetical protein [Methylicorpusculum sp.]
MNIIMKTCLFLVLTQFGPLAVAMEDNMPQKSDMKMDKPMKHKAGMGAGKEEGMAGMGGGKEGGMGNMDESKMMEHMKMRQEHDLKMHDLSNKILAETDPAKKQALKDQQIELMKSHHMHMMQMMKNHKM